MLRRRAVPRFLLLGILSALFCLALPAIASADIPLTVSGSLSDFITSLTSQEPSDCITALGDYSSISGSLYLHAGVTTDGVLWPDDCDDLYLNVEEDGTVDYALGDDATSIMQAYSDSLQLAQGAAPTYTGADGHGGTLEADGQEGADELVSGTVPASDEVAQYELGQAVLDDGISGVAASASVIPALGAGLIWLTYDDLTTGSNPVSNLIDKWFGFDQPAPLSCAGSCVFGVDGEGLGFSPYPICFASDDAYTGWSSYTSVGAACTPEYAAENGDDYIFPPGFYEIGSSAYEVANPEDFPEVNNPDYYALGWSANGGDVFNTAGDPASGICGNTPVNFGAQDPLFYWTPPGDTGCPTTPMFADYVPMEPTQERSTAPTHTPADTITIAPTGSAPTSPGVSISDPSTATVPQVVVPGFTTQPAPQPLYIPTPSPNELWTTYDNTLVTDGFTNVSENVLSDADEDTAVGPSAVAGVTPSVGTAVSPDTAITVDVNPDDAPTPGGSGGGFIPGPTLPGIHFPDIAPLCNVFPFGIPCWLGGVLAQFASSPVAPDLSFPVEPFGHLSVDLGTAWGGGLASLMVFIRAFILIGSFVYMLLWLGRFLGYGAPPSGGVADDTSDLA
jgi:hypothetical protein